MKYILQNKTMFLTVSRTGDRHHRLSELVDGEFQTVVALSGQTNMPDLARHVAYVIHNRHTKPPCLIVDAHGLGGCLLDFLSSHRDHHPEAWGRCEVRGG